MSAEVDTAKRLLTAADDYRRFYLHGTKATGKFMTAAHDIVVDAIKKALTPTHSKLLARYAEVFPHYEWVDAETSIDMMAAEIKALRHELGNAQRTLLESRTVAEKVGE